MAIHTFNPAEFRAAFPAFSSDTLYTDQQLQIYWDFAVCAMTDADNCGMSGDCLQHALNLMTAHITQILTKAAYGQGSVGVKTQAHVDKVQVTYAPPPFKTGWQAWLAQTPYGMTLWALLSAAAVGGFYFNGRPEQNAFRKVGGYFRG